MVKLEDAIIAKLEHNGNRFEILVDPDLALKLRKGEIVSIEALLATDTIFSDAKKGTEAASNDLMQTFQTNELEKIVKKIIQSGSVQLTTRQRKELLEQKRKEIIDFISKNAFNPQTKTPHPLARIQTAIEEAKIHIDPMKPVKEQVEEIVKKIRGLIPISMEKIKVALKIPKEHASSVYGIVHKYDIQKEEWESDGSFIVIIEIAGGLKQKLFGELNGITHGDFESKIIIN